MIITDAIIASLWFAIKCLLIGTGLMFWFVYITKKYASALITRLLLMMFKGIFNPGKKLPVQAPETEPEEA